MPVTVEGRNTGESVRESRKGKEKKSEMGKRFAAIDKNNV
jgi:hypothetical protein